ncbi:MFS transporter [Variovorax sp. OV329]|uniref:MFS transporter n=1 Tax=Variovorax sp. OV329 TaxID=1882825 RepID=UPI0008EDDEDF|nr:MFS transporter [Variovorax sp. OV329]SFM65877.1 Sugar phosphate permease [Variovorax sp. OV329]
MNERAWLPLAITTAIQVLVSAAVLTLPVMAPAVALALGTSPAYTGVYVAIVYGGAMLASLAAGTAVTRFGAIRMSQVGLLLCAAGLALSALPSLPAIALGALLIGLGYGPITPSSSHLLARTTPAHRMSLVFSVKQTGVPLGGVVAGAVVPGLMLWGGWQAALLAVAAANVLCVLLAQVLRKELDVDRDPQQKLVLGNLARPVRLVLAHPALRMLAGCSFVFSMCQLSLTAYLVTYLDAVLAYGLVAAGLALSLAQIGGVIGRVLWGYVADRWLGARRMLTALSVLMCVSALATALLDGRLPSVLVLAVLIVFGASAIGWNGVYLAETARQAPPGQASIATGGTLAVTYFGVVLGPPAFGALATVFGSYRAGFFALAVATALCTLALLRGRRQAAATGAA